MNRHILIATLLFGISSLAAAGNNEPVKACELLQDQSLAAWGYGDHPRADSQSQSYRKAEVNAPSDVHADICTLLGETDEERITTFVVVESFGDNTSAEAIADWIKITSSQVKQEDVTAAETQIGDATCESGKYNAPAKGHPVSQYYVACDRLVGTRHLTVNMQQPEEAKLPTPAQVKELLDQATARLGLQALQSI